MAAPCAYQHPGSLDFFPPPQKLALIGGNARFVSLIDSNVGRCSAAKGRSSSRALAQSLDRSAATATGFGLYAALTRLMPADNPSQGSEPDPPGPGLGVQCLPAHLSRALLALPRIRLVLLLGFRPLPSGDSSLRYAAWSFRLFACPPLDFDSTLGFSGEGPCTLSLAAAAVCLVWFSGLGGSCSPFCHGMPLSASALAPRNAADRARQNRREGTELEQERHVEATTKALRQRLWREFELWLVMVGVGVELFDPEAPPEIDNINAVMSRYGRELFAAGRPYGHFSETVNALSARIPKVRRLLQPTWDVAFNWMKREPHVHHNALPWQVLLAMVSVCCFWGWPTVAGLLALSWGGLARIGEVLAARRRDLVIPSDLDGTVNYALLSIREPKTRNRAARHQALKLDQPHLLDIVIFAFGGLPPAAPLWPMSGQTLRNRFKLLLDRLGLSKSSSAKQLDLASLRAGGATWLMHTTEDAELVRRRGRWLNHRIMEIYVQEVTAVLLTPTLSAEVRSGIFALMHSYPDIIWLWYNCFHRGFGNRPR